jgi:hypothetical protein
MDRLFRATIAHRWGLRFIDDGNSTATIQGVDYTTTTKAAEYGDAWVVRDAKLRLTNEKQKWTDESTKATLVFVSGPNASNGGTNEGSMKRTRNVLACTSYEFFRSCVTVAIRAGLDAMISEKVKIALVARISCGIYAGEHKKRINEELLEIVQEILNEYKDGKARGDHFHEVIIPKIPPKPNSKKHSMGRRR